MPVELAIGFFDGVHLGHRRVIERTVKRAREQGARAVVFTFREHPRAVLGGSRAAPPLLTSRERRVALLREMGVDEVVCVPFTSELARLEPAEFAARLRGRFPALDTVFCGANWRFGAGGRGDARALRACGVKVCAVRHVIRGGLPVSSTRVRAALAEGDVALAERLLGREVEVLGRVVRGKGVGRQLGFPTLNVVPDCAGALPCGVYAVRTEAGWGVANWGFAPTMGARAWTSPVWEIHLLEPPLAARPPAALAFAVKARLRSERKFRSLAALQRAIESDRRAVVALAESGRG